MKLTEKQKLLKRLKAFCGMLGDDIESLDADLRTRLEDTIERLSAKRKIAIGGLSGSQHRDIGEFLLGETLFNSVKNVEDCPHIQVRYGKEPKTHAIFGETRKTYPGLSLSLALAGKTPDAIGLEVKNPLAADINFVILPAYDGDDSRAGYLVNLLDNTETIVWCSDATAPWQPKERRLWFTVPDSLKKRSILALTGAERLTDDASRLALEEKREFVSDEFHFFSTISADVAKSATKSGTVTDAAKFAESGGENLLKQVMSLLQSDQKDLLEQARAVRAEIDLIPLGGDQPVPVAPLAETLEPTPSTPEDTLKASLLADSRRCVSAVGQCKANDFGPLFEEMNELLSNLSKAVRADVTFDRDQDLMVKQVDEAAELVGLLSYENNSKASQEAADTVRQISLDVLSRLSGENNASTRIVSDSSELSKAS